MNVSRYPTNRGRGTALEMASLVRLERVCPLCNCDGVNFVREVIKKERKQRTHQESYSDPEDPEQKCEKIVDLMHTSGIVRDFHLEHGLTADSRTISKRSACVRARSAVIIS